MSDRFSPVPTRDVPVQRAPLEHPMRPDLPTQRTEAPYEPGMQGYPPAAVDEGYGRWSFRVAAVLLDLLLQVPFLVAQLVGYVVAYDGGGLTRIDRAGYGVWNDGLEVHTAQMTTNTWIGLAIANVAGLGLLVFTIWNTIVRQGRRGASIGKQCMHLVVVSERDGRPIGALLTLVRGWVHVVDLVTLGIGYLWPLWDRKRQTFADMIMGTAVLHLPPRPQPTPQLPAQITPTYDW